MSSAPVLPDARKIPATVITGFLGAGKTTLIRHLMETASAGETGRRIALIINEFGDVGVDKGLLASCGIEGCSDEEVIELANGCLCCTVADEFVPAMEALLERDPAPEHIIIETSGLALPKPLVKAFDWPSVRARVTVDGVVTVVDGRAAADGRFADDPDAVAAQRAEDDSLDHDNPLEEVFEDQLACADLVLINKSDLLSSGESESLRDSLKAALRPGVSLAAMAHGKVDPAVALGIAAAVEDDLAVRPSHHDGPHDDHDHEDFDSFSVDPGPVSDPKAFQKALPAVLERFGILRLKGRLNVPGKPMGHVIQAVGPRVDGYFDRPWQADGSDRRSALVVIGMHGLDKEAITEAICAAAT